MIEWEMFFSQSLRAPTDVTLSGEAKNRLPYSATTWCESEESVLSGFTGSKINLCFHRHTDGRRSTFSASRPCRPTQMFSLLHTRDICSGWPWVELCWELWGHQANKNDNDKSYSTDSRSYSCQVCKLNSHTERGLLRKHKRNHLCGWMDQRY